MKEIIIQILNNDVVLGGFFTILGTIIGWLLGLWFQKGKVNISIVEFNDVFTCGEDLPVESIKEATNYKFSLTVDVFNSSSHSKIMRDIRVLFKGEGKSSASVTPYDENTRKGYGISGSVERIKVVNIPAKSVVSLSLSNYSTGADMFDYIWNTEEVFLTYKDEKNREKKVKIKTEDYKNYFTNHKWEDEVNG